MITIFFFRNIDKSTFKSGATIESVTILGLSEEISTVKVSRQQYVRISDVVATGNIVMMENLQLEMGTDWWIEFS